MRFIESCCGPTRLLVLAGILIGYPLHVNGQQPEAVAGNQALQLNLQGEIPLVDFIDYVSKRLNVRIVYDESIRTKKVNLVAPDPIPIQGLPGILQTVLINEGLILTDTGREGFKRITTNQQIPRLARPSSDAENLAELDAALPITRVFVVRDTLPSKLVDIVTPVLSSAGANSIPLDRSRLLIITDVAHNVRRAEQLIRIVDGQQTQVLVEFVAAKNVSADSLSERLKEILAAKQKAMGLGGEESATGGLQVSVDQRTSSLVLIGTALEIKSVKELIERLDGAIETKQQTFQLRYISPSGLDDAVRAVLESRPQLPVYRSHIEGNALIVESTAEVLGLVERTREQLDTREAPNAQSPIPLLQDQKRSCSGTCRDDSGSWRKRTFFPAAGLASIRGGRQQTTRRYRAPIYLHWPIQGRPNPFKFL